MSWIGLLTVVLMVISGFFGYVKYKEHVKEVQRDLYGNLVGRTYPHFSDGYDSDEFNFQVINLSTERAGLRDWRTTVVLKFDIEEFPWAGHDLEEWYSDSEIVNPPVNRDDIDSIEDVMAEDLLYLCSINRKNGPQFIPEFFDSAYGPTLLLTFRTTDLYLITEQLEMVAEVVPIVFSMWFKSVAGLRMQHLFPAFLKVVSENPEIVSKVGSDEEQALS